MAIFTEKNATTAAKKTEIARIKPMVIRDSESGDVYELDFSRETVRFAESRGFEVGQLGDFPITRVPELFFYAFRKNHKNVARAKTDDLLYEKLGGLTSEQLERLVQLYTQPYKAIIVGDDEVTEKNSTVTVEL